MTYSTEHSKIRARFSTEWALVNPTVPVSYPNVAFTPPSGSWVRLVIDNAAARQVSIGGTDNVFRDQGTVTVQVFDPVGGGDAAALTLADDAADIFRAWTDTGIQFFAPDIRSISTDPTWYQVNVITEFYQDTAL